MPQVLVDFYVVVFWSAVAVFLFVLTGYIMYKISDGETWGMTAFLLGWLTIWFAIPFLYWYFTGEVMLDAD